MSDQNLQPGSSELARRQSRRMRRSLACACAFAALLWLIKTAETWYGLELGRYGVFPQHLEGLAGVLWAPLIHGSWEHLAANTGPVIILGTTLFYGYPRAARWVVPAVYLGTGLAVWLLARPVYHIGASGLTFGAMFFISTIGVLRRDRQAIALSLATLLLYGGMLGGFAPREGISFETHLAAACLGVVLAFALKNLDPPPPRKVYSWEHEEELPMYEDPDEFEYEYDDDGEPDRPDRRNWN